MARIAINLGTPPEGRDGDPVRTAFEKVNLMTTELYTGLAQTTSGGWGKQDAIRLGDGTNMNNLPYVNAIYTLTGSTNTNTPEGVQNGHIMVQCADIFVRQTFRQIGTNVTWERAGQSGSSFSAWARVAQVGGNLGNGFGGDNLYKGNLDSLVSVAPIGMSQWRCDQATTGSLPPGFVNNAPFDGCTVVVSKYNNDWCRMWLTGGTGGQGGSLGGTYTRLTVAGQQGVWLLEYNIQNTLNPVDSANGRTGLMDNRAVGIWRVNRFANGFQVASAALDNISLAANEIKATPFTAPVSFPDWGKTSVRVTAAPGSNTDWYGVTTTTMSSPTAGYFHLRNGQSAQMAQEVRITITGYWK